MLLKFATMNQQTNVFTIRYPFESIPCEKMHLLLDVVHDYSMDNRDWVTIEKGRKINTMNQVKTYTEMVV